MNDTAHALAIDSRQPLRLDLDRSDERTLVTVSGELDASSASTLYGALADLEIEDAHDVVLDLARVTFMDSTGLSVIITEHKRLQHLGGRLTIFSPPSSVRRLFTITALDSVLDIVPTHE